MFNFILGGVMFRYLFVFFVVFVLVISSSGGQPRIGAGGESLVAVDTISGVWRVYLVDVVSGDTTRLDSVVVVMVGDIFRMGRLSFEGRWFLDGHFLYVGLTDWDNGCRYSLGISMLRRDRIEGMMSVEVESSGGVYYLNFVAVRRIRRGVKG